VAVGAGAGQARGFRGFAEQTRHYFTRPHERVPEPPLAGPAAWRGETLREREPLWRRRLTPAHVAELEQAMAGVRRRNLRLGEVTREDFPLATLTDEIAQWRHAITHGLGFVVVSALPVADWSHADAELAFWGIGHHLGVPGAQNPDEELLGHVRDYGEAEHNPAVRLYRTRATIDFHCDAADVVGLACLRPARAGGQSRIVSTVTLFNELAARHPELVPRLFEPFKLDGRGENRPGSRPYSEVAPCRFSGSELRTFYHSEYFRSVERLEGVSLSDAERTVLDIYDAVAADPAVHLDMWLEPGDLQFVSNHTIAHARTAYEDDADPARRRHLLRLWLSLE
jgi:hypothetical protein